MSPTDPSNLGQGGIIGAIVALLVAIAYRLVNGYKKAPAEDSSGSIPESGRVQDLQAQVNRLQDQLDQERRDRQRDRQEYEDRIERMRDHYERQLEKLREDLMDEILDNNQQNVSS